eukprot:219416-Pyramimonas_sp.AAC.1
MRGRLFVGGAWGPGGPSCATPRRPSLSPPPHSEGGGVGGAGLQAPPSPAPSRLRKWGVGEKPGRGGGIGQSEESRRASPIGALA